MLTAGWMTPVALPGGTSVRCSSHAPVALRTNCFSPTPQSHTHSVPASEKTKPCGATRPVRPSDVNDSADVEGATPTLPVVDTRSSVPKLTYSRPSNGDTSTPRVRSTRR